MAVPEKQLEIWSHQGAITQSKDTYATVKRSLEAPNTAYAAKAFKVFLQGSYVNDTNIYAESDVDAVIRLDSIYYFDTNALGPQELAAFNAGLAPGTYPYDAYKGDVFKALQNSFGAAAVKPGTRAVKIKADGNRRSADVIAAAEFRRYRSAPLTGGILAGLAGPQYDRGICFFTSSGDRIVNYPEQHCSNCTAKHQGTNGWFKPMVRIVKNMRGKLVSDRVIERKCAPSYFIEGLLYNVPNEQFGRSYGATFVAAMNWLLQADRTQFLCANEQYYLLRDSVAMCWPCGNCDLFLNAVADLWNNW